MRKFSAREGLGRTGGVSPIPRKGPIFADKLTALIQGRFSDVE